MFSIFLLLAICGLTNGSFYGKQESPNWNQLSVTFGKFSKLPHNESDAKQNGWKLVADGCKSFTFYQGKRYVKDDDTATMILFDKDGKIAGLQMSFPKTFPVAKNHIGGAFQIENDKYVLTSYFTKPSKICSGKRTVPDGYIGDKLFLITNPKHLMEIPLKESGIPSTKWTKGRCFPGMGQHYWYNVKKDMNCDDALPFFLLYNGGNLNGYGFATFGDLKGTSRVEHPSQRAIRSFFEEKPVCIEKVSAFTSQHVYLERMPYLNKC